MIKNKDKLEQNFEVLIPSGIFKDRRTSLFESLVKYLKEGRDLNYHQIAILLNRDERNVWTIYNRAVKKRKR